MSSNQQSETQNIVVLTCNDETNPYSSEQTIIVVGTAHLSRESCRRVRDIIIEKKPQAVFLELCKERKDIVLAANTVIREPTLDDLIKMWKNGKSSFEILYSWVLGRFGEKNDIMPGEEFRVATEEASKINAMVILGDRPVSITMSRLWANLTSWQKLCLCTQLVISGVLYPSVAHLNDIFEGNQTGDEVNEAIEDLSIAYPALKTQLIDERDEYMVHKLRLMASRFSLVVAVVGAGHVQGISRTWNKQFDFYRLCEMPEKKENLSNLWNYAVIGISVVGILGWGIYKYRNYKYF